MGPNPKLLNHIRRNAVLIAAIALLNCLGTILNGGELEIRVVDDESGTPLAVRMRVYDARGRKPKPKGLPLHEGHFTTDGPFILRLGNGRFLYELEAGPEYQKMVGSFDMSSKATDNKTLRLKRIVDMKSHGWWSGDMWVERKIGDLPLLMVAEDLHVLAAPTPEKSSTPGAAPQLENRMINLQSVAKDLGGRRHAYRVGEEARHISAAQPTAWDLPLWLAEGTIDSLAVLRPDFDRRNSPAGFPVDRKMFPGSTGTGRFREYVYYQILNAGIKMAPTAISGSGISSEHPGSHRAYVHFDGEFAPTKWWEAIKAGRTLISSGPLMLPKVNNRYPGFTFVSSSGDPIELTTSLTLHTRDKLEYLQFIKNGKSVAEVRLDESAKKGRTLPKVNFDKSGWMLVRAVIENADDYRYASTAPYYVDIGESPYISKSACDFFLNWLLLRAKQVKKSDLPNKDKLMKRYRAARDYWRERSSRATEP